jgi:hypothetical protein
MNDGSEISYNLDGKDIRIILPRIKKDIVDYIVEISLK